MWIFIRARDYQEVVKFGEIEPEIDPGDLLQDFREHQEGTWDRVVEADFSKLLWDPW